MTLAQNIRAAREAKQLSRSALGILCAAAPELLEACEDNARQLESLAGKLASTGQPGHVDYISKADAAEWCNALASTLRATIANTKEVTV